VTDSDDATATGPDAAPAIALDKVITDGAPFEEVGDVIEYELTATNTGNVTLFDVVISDPDATIDSCVPEQPAELSPGAELVCQASYSVTQADVDAGEFINEATVDAVDPNATPVSDDDDATADGPDAAPAIELDKQADNDGPVGLGDEVFYTLVATNVGNVTLTEVIVEDSLIDLDCTPATPAELAPGEVVSCTGSYTVTQADIDDGDGVVNVATAQGDGPDDTPVADDDSVLTPVDDAVPGLELDKQADTVGPVGLGDEIGYTITATNTGNVTLTDVMVIDDLIALECQPELPGALEPGESLVCTGTYTVEPSDLGGDVVNVATASGESPDGDTVSDDDNVAVPALDPIPVPVNGPVGLLLLILLLGLIGAARAGRQGPGSLLPQ